MRYLYFACISLSFVLLLCNHAHARIRESYEDSVARYTAAGFTEERTRVRVEPDDKGRNWKQTSAPPRCKGYKEVTWTNKDPQGGGEIGVVSIRQLFYGEWPPTMMPERKWKQVLHCIEITYEFRDPIKDPKNTPEVRGWVEQLVKESLEDFTRYGGSGEYVHGIRWERGLLAETLDFTIDPHASNGSFDISKGKFHTGGKCLTILLGDNHLADDLRSYSDFDINRYRDLCWFSGGRGKREKPTQHELAERERQRQKELQRMRDAAAKEIEESGL